MAVFSFPVVRHLALAPWARMSGEVCSTPTTGWTPYRCCSRRSSVPDDDGPKIRKEFSVKPGETFDVGDVLIEKPQNRR
jgi:hypothetical protein